MNYETNELVIFTTDIASDYRFYSLAQNPCYRNEMTAKGYVQAHMLDYFPGFVMDAPKKPDIEIIGGSREMSFADVNFDEPDSGNASSDTGEKADSTVNTTALTVADAPRLWNVVRGAEGLMLNANGLARRTCSSSKAKTAPKPCGWAQVASHTPTELFLEPLNPGDYSPMVRPSRLSL